LPEAIEFSFAESARRQPSVHLHSTGVDGLVQVLNATLLGSGCVGSNAGIVEIAGGGTTLATR